MNGFTATRSARSPGIFRDRFLWPGMDEATRVVRVPMPRSPFSQMSF